MEASTVAPTLATAERVCPADAGPDRRDRPARTLALPARCASVEGIVFVRIPALSDSARAFYYRKHESRTETTRSVA